MPTEDENNEKTKKNKNARGDDENAKNAFVAKKRIANVEGRKRTADEKNMTADDKKRTADDKKRTADDKKRTADDKKRSADVDNRRTTDDNRKFYANERQRRREEEPNKRSVNPPGWDPFQRTGVADRGLVTPHALVRRAVRLLVGAVGVNRIDRPGVLSRVTKGSRGVNSTDPSIPSAKSPNASDASRAFQRTGVVDPDTAEPNVPVPHVVRIMAGAAGELGIDRPGVPDTARASGVDRISVRMTERVHFKLTKVLTHCFDQL